jgi:hypothetical protein
MIPRRIAILAVAVLLVSAAWVAGGDRAAGDRKAKAAAAAAWSEEVRGVRGRLRILRGGSAGSTIAIELRNASRQPVAVSNQLRIQAQLVDSDGRQVTTSRAARVRVPGAQWGVIPSQCYLGIRVGTMQPDRTKAYALVFRTGPTLRACWLLQPGTYVLRAKLVGQETRRMAQKGEPPADHWEGELELPPLEVRVPAPAAT